MVTESVFPRRASVPQPFTWTPNKITWSCVDSGGTGQFSWTENRGTDPWPTQPGRVFMNMWVNTGSTWAGTFSYNGVPNRRFSRMSAYREGGVFCLSWKRSSREVRTISPAEVSRVDPRDKPVSPFVGTRLAPAKDVSELSEFIQLCRSGRFYNVEL
jgi:hypothetical protein